MATDLVRYGNNDLLPFCRSCFMVFPSLQLTLALSCVMGLVMFACYCGEDHSRKLGASKRDAVSVHAGLILYINDITRVPKLFTAKSGQSK